MSAPQSDDPIAPNDESGSGSITADGHWVVFASEASNLVDENGDGNNDNDDLNGVSDVFVRDVTAGLVRRVSRGTPTADEVIGVEADGASTQPAISDDGRFVVFATTASNLGVVIQIPR